MSRKQRNKRFQRAKRRWRLQRSQLQRLRRRNTRSRNNHLFSKSNKIWTKKLNHSLLKLLPTTSTPTPIQCIQWPNVHAWQIIIRTMRTNTTLPTTISRPRLTMTSVPMQLQDQVIAPNLFKSRPTNSTKTPMTSMKPMSNRPSEYKQQTVMNRKLMLMNTNEKSNKEFNELNRPNNLIYLS